MYPSIQSYRRFWKENSNTRKVSTPKKKQDISHVTTKTKGENHINIMPSIAVNITGTKNYLSYLSISTESILQ